MTKLRLPIHPQRKQLGTSRDVIYRSYFFCICIFYRILRICVDCFSFKIVQSKFILRNIVNCTAV